MIENNLLKSNFLGRDGFRWWIGQIPPRETWALQWSKKPQAWGNRVRVRIMGYHPQNVTELPDKDLPWATIIVPTNNGSGKNGYKKGLRINQGDIVVGFFLDGDDAQLPAIIGVIGNSRYAKNKKFPSPFEPFSGYTPETTPGDKTIVKNETMDDSTETDSPIIQGDKKLVNQMIKWTFRPNKPSGKPYKVDKKTGEIIDDVKRARNKFKRLIYN